MLTNYENKAMQVANGEPVDAPIGTKLTLTYATGDGERTDTFEMTASGWVRHANAKDG